MRSPELKDEILRASRRKHLKREGLSSVAWSQRLVKIIFSPRTGSLGDRVTTIRNELESGLRSMRLREPADLGRGFVRLDPWEAEYLFNLTATVEIGVVEVGRFLGGSTFLLAAATSKPIWSIDIAPRDDSGLRLLLRAHNLDENVHLIVGDSRVDHEEIREFDLLFIDGDHSVEGCLADIRQWWPKLSLGGHMVFHDCYYGCGVQSAVAQFLRESADVDVVVGPVKPEAHHQLETGSVCHVRKTKM